MQERRDRERFGVWFPMKIAPDEGREEVAVSRNLSENGLMMATAKRLQPGEPVTITFQVTSDDRERTVQGRIIRTEPNHEDPDGLWPHRVAVAFDEPVAELESLLRRIASPSSSPPPPGG